MWLHISPWIYISSWTSPYPTIEVTTEHQAELPILYIRFLLAIHFTYNSGLTSVPVSQFIPPKPSPSTCPCPTSVSLFLPCAQVHMYHFSRFYLLVLIYKMYVYIYIYIFLFLTSFSLYDRLCTLFTIVRTWKPPKCSSAGKWIKKM